jgi:hypothetical protein
MAEIMRLWLAALLALSPYPIPQPSESLCVLQQKVAQGDHVKVKVAGIYSSGVDQGVLEDSSCSGQYSWVELDLQSSRNKNKLKKLMDAAGKARVVFDGEFFGPPKVDEKLPPSIQKSYHPGWGHLGAFKSKFVVHTILEVAPAPPPKS